MVGMPKPIYLVVCKLQMQITRIIPPIKGRKGGYGIVLLNKWMSLCSVQVYKRATKPKQIPATIATPIPSQLISGTNEIVYCVCCMPQYLQVISATRAVIMLG